MSYFYRNIAMWYDNVLMGNLQFEQLSQQTYKRCDTKMIGFDLVLHFQATEQVDGSEYTVEDTRKQTRESTEGYS